MTQKQVLKYAVRDLESARIFCATHSEYDIIITNETYTIYCYGIMVLDYIFKTLQVEFPYIIKIIIDVDDNHAALFSAIKLNYQHIHYIGESMEAKMILQNHIALL
jgi:hypothetical protein